MDTDVYKRQEEQNQRLSPDGMLDAFKDGVNSLSEEYVAQLDSGRYVWVRVEAVSYTHLDVYKRQGQQMRRH